MKFCIIFIIFISYATIINSRTIDNESIDEIKKDIENLKATIKKFGDPKEISEEISTIRIGMFIVVGSIVLVTALAINISFKLICNSTPEENKKPKIVENNVYGDERKNSKKLSNASNIYAELNEENQYDEIPAYKHQVPPLVANKTYQR